MNTTKTTTQINATIHGQRIAFIEDSGLSVLAVSPGEKKVYALSPTYRTEGEFKLWGASKHGRCFGTVNWDGRNLTEVAA